MIFGGPCWVRTNDHLIMSQKYTIFLILIDLYKTPKYAQKWGFFEFRLRLILPHLAWFG